MKPDQIKTDKGIFQYGWNGSHGVSASIDRLRDSRGRLDAEIQIHCVTGRIYHSAINLLSAKDRKAVATDCKAKKADKNWNEFPWESAIEKACMLTIEKHREHESVSSAMENRTEKAWTCADLLTAEFPPPVWVVPGLLPVGLAILAGRPKLGKSRLALQLAVAVGSGGVWLDRHVEQGEVLLLPREDSPRRIQKRLRDVKTNNDTAIHFEFGLPAPLNTQDGIDWFWERVDQIKPKLVILDTLARCFDGKIDWNAVGDTVNALSSIQAEAMQRDICILVVDHHRKGSGENRDVISDVMSSIAKPGIADTIMGFYRGSGKKEWTLSITGRDVEENELALNYDGVTGCWQCLGDAETVRKDSVQAEVVAAMTELGGKATTTEIANHSGLDGGLVSRTLSDLVADGFVSKGKREGKNVPYTLI